jgi:hypothetical protein
VFTDIAARIDIVFRADFLSGIDVVQYFVQKAEQVYECTPAAIARLPNLGIEWHAELLAAYLVPSVVPPQYRAVYAIVSAFPDLLPNLFAADGRDLTLIAFLLSSLDGPEQKVEFVGEMIDGFPSILSIGEIETCLNIFSRCRGLNFECDTEMATFRCDNHFCQVPVEQLKARSSFYSFDLPFDLLVPSESDNLFTLARKFRALSKIPAKSSGIFEQFISRPYDELTIACLQNLGSCINELGEIFGEVKSRRFLKRIVLANPTSWFHAPEILALLRVLDESFLP